MSKVFKCPVLSKTPPDKWVYITEANCENARAYGHHYCKQCDKHGEPLKKKNVETGKYIRFMWEILKDAVDVFQKNDSRIEKIWNYWSDHRPPRRKSEKKYFIKHLSDCIEMRRDIVDTREWFMSDDNQLGCFVWLCNHLGHHYDNSDAFAPEKARMRLELYGTEMAEGSGCAYPELQPLGRPATVSRSAAT